MQAKLIGYQHRDTVIHRLSGAGKLLFFILVSLAAMISYDTRMLLLIAIFSVFLLYLSEIRFKDVSLQPRSEYLHWFADEYRSFGSFCHRICFDLEKGTDNPSFPTRLSSWNYWFNLGHVGSQLCLCCSFVR